MRPRERIFAVYHTPPILPLVAKFFYLPDPPAITFDSTWHWREPQFPVENSLVRRAEMHLPEETYSQITSPTPT